MEHGKQALWPIANPVIPPESSSISSPPRLLFPALVQASKLLGAPLGLKLSEKMSSRQIFSQDSEAVDMDSVRCGRM